MFYKFCCLFIMFFISSVIGFIGEIIFCSIGEKKIILNRGFLVGPYIPIYGVGTVGCYLALARYKNDPITLFFMSAILATVLEYITSWLMEKIFKVRWWDYSDESFNVNGRVCLKNSLIFGLVGLGVIHGIYPFLNGIVLAIPKTVTIVLSIVFIVVFVTDLVFTATTLFGIRNNLKNFHQKDITETAHYEVMKKLNKHNFRINRVLQAFPGSEEFNNTEFKQLKQLVYEYRKIRKNKKKNKIH